MLSSTIESEYGGDINITSGGTIDVGSTLVPSFSNQRPLGIVSLWAGNISVIADGDMNVDGSRIAAYDGGNIFVESLTGNVNAGSGGSGCVLVTKPYLNKHGQVEDLNDVIPGSGILATSFPQLIYGQTSGQIGNITVETPEGNIVAEPGGHRATRAGARRQNDATINLSAGTRNSDGSVAYVGNVDASGSGVIGGQVNIYGDGKYQWPGGGQRGRECERLAKCQRDGFVARRGHRQRGRDGQRDHCGRGKRVAVSGATRCRRGFRGRRCQQPAERTRSGGCRRPDGQQFQPPPPQRRSKSPSQLNPTRTWLPMALGRRQRP